MANNGCLERNSVVLHVDAIGETPIWLPVAGNLCQDKPPELCINSTHFSAVAPVFVCTKKIYYNFGVIVGLGADGNSRRLSVMRVFVIERYPFTRKFK